MATSYEKNCSYGLPCVSCVFCKGESLDPVKLA